VIEIDRFSATLAEGGALAMAARANRATVRLAPDPDASVPRPDAGRCAASPAEPATSARYDLEVSAVNLADKLAMFSEHWQPRTVAQFNGHDVMVVKLQGEFPWHKHDDTDDVFLVLSGRVTIQLRDRDVALGPGEMFVVPRGVEHRPVAAQEAHVLLIEPTGTPNSGDPATAAPRRVI